jgi:hypothetical protein
MFKDKKRNFQNSTTKNEPLKFKDENQTLCKIEDKKNILAIYIYIYNLLLSLPPLSPESKSKTTRRSWFTLEAKEWPVQRPYHYHHLFCPSLSKPLISRKN